MAWSWSHSQEAYENARENLSTLDRETLEIIFAEWRAAQGKGGIIHDHNHFQRLDVPLWLRLPLRVIQSTG